MSPASRTTRTTRTRSASRAGLPATALALGLLFLLPLLRAQVAPGQPEPHPQKPDEQRPRGGPPEVARQPTGPHGAPPAANTRKPDIQQEASLSLAAIAQHQEALRRECHAFKRDRWQRLEQLVQYARAERLELGQRALAVQVPAVCLLLDGDFSRRATEPDLDRERANGEDEERAGRRVELVNWVLADEELAAPAAGRPARSPLSASNMTKRQAPSLAPPPPSLEPAPAALADYLFEVPPAGANEMAAPETSQERAERANEVEEDAKEDATEREEPATSGAPKQSRIARPKWHAKAKQLLAAPAFRDMLAKDRRRLEGHLSPVILVPGLLGSRLEARTNKQRRVNVLCSQQTDWQAMWLSLRQFLPIVSDCWLDNARLELDARPSGWTRQPDGVEARVADFGSVESVRHLDLRQAKMTRYFAPLIEHYERLGYTPDRNLLAAPYDFRLAPQQLGAEADAEADANELDQHQRNYFTALRRLIERAYEQSAAGPRRSARRVTLVCHSMGCTHLLVFLRQQPADWRQRHLRKLVALSSPWGGAVKALKALVVGDQLDLPLISETKMRALARTYPSIAFLLPQEEVFNATSWRRAQPGGPVLVDTPQRQYRAADLAALLQHAGLQRQLDWFRRTSALLRPLEPLADLRVDCVHSRNTPTPETLIFRRQEDFPDGDYELVRGDGDGTVNLESLLVCERWASQLPGLVRHKVIMNTDHLGVLGHPQTLDYIMDDVLTASD